MMHIKQLLLAALVTTYANPSHADLIICNKTESIQGLSIAYHGRDGTWTSEGWWNIDPGECATPLTGLLTKQLYYYRTEINGGDFDGEGYFFCTSPNEYTIQSGQSCEDQGYFAEDFRLIDHGNSTDSFTLTLVE